MSELPNVKELEKLLKMCRKQGITELTMQGMSFKFGDIPRDPGEAEEPAEVVSLAMPSPEEMAYWSSQPDPLAERTAQ